MKTYKTIPYNDTVLVVEERLPKSGERFITNLGGIGMPLKGFAYSMHPVIICQHPPLEECEALEGVPIWDDKSVHNLSIKIGLEKYIGGNYDFENGVRVGYNSNPNTFTIEQVRKALVMCALGDSSVQQIINLINTPTSVEIESTELINGKVIINKINY